MAQKKQYGFLAMAALMLIMVSAVGCKALGTQPAKNDNGFASGDTRTNSAEVPMLPSNASIRYNDDGTLAMVKGEALDAALSDDPAYMAAKRSGDFGKVALQLLESWKALLKVEDPAQAFAVVDVKVDNLKSTHVKLEQRVGEIPVWGKYVIVHLNQSNAVYLFQGDYILVPEDLEAEAAAEPGIDKTTAAGNAVTALSGKDANWRTEGAQRYIFVEPSGTAHSTYGVIVSRGLVERFMCFVDARNGAVLHKISLVQHATTF